MPAASPPWWSRFVTALRASRPGRFRLMEYFTATSLVAFAAVAIALYLLQRSEENFFALVQQEQGEFFAAAQEQLVREHGEAARRDLLTVHEAGHVTLTRVFANALWASHFAPLVDTAQLVPIEHCRAIATDGTALQQAGSNPPEAAADIESQRQACAQALGRKIRSLPGLADINRSVHAMTRGSAVFKIKVYDLRGLTVYSSELAQIGEDKASNRGWKSAARGTPASELVHHERMSTFEGEVEDRDLIQSYVPVYAPGSERLAGVFEIYSDVTPFLQQINAVSARIGAASAASQSKAKQAALENQRNVESASRRLFLIIGALLALLYGSLLVLMRNGQRIIDEQARVREDAIRREHAWHGEKMAALATMAANVSHEVGNPLAVIAGLAEDIARAQAAGTPLGEQPRMIREQTSRIARMTRQITEFAAAHRETPAPLDINPMVKAVCDFSAFDRRFRGTHIETQLADGLPACVGIPDHVNEVLMNVLQAHQEASLESPMTSGRIVVTTEARGREVGIVVESDGTAESAAALAGDPRIGSARLRMEAMGGRLASAGSATDIVLPAFSVENAPPAAAGHDGRPDGKVV